MRTGQSIFMEPACCGQKSARIAISFSQRDPHFDSNFPLRVEFVPSREANLAARVGQL